VADYLSRWIVSLGSDSGLPEDAIQNTWYFDGDDGNTEAEYISAAFGQLTAFYQAIDGTILSAHVNGTATCKAYNLRDAEPRVPVFTDTFTVTPAGGSPLPNEVAMVLSFSADVGSGEVAARRRGRVFLGPVSIFNTAELNGECVPGSTMLSTVATAAHDLAVGEPLTTGSSKWAIFSPTTYAATSDYDASVFDVTHGWVDNAFDTQRRRGHAASTRTTWTD
jgi:hypothetical protein